MKPNPAHFSIHDVSDFPIVRFRPETAVEGYAPLWENDMDALLRHGAPFVMLFEEKRSDEAHADRKRRGLWLKHHKVALAAICRGLVSIEPDGEKRAQLQAMAAGAMKAFGILQEVAATREQADALMVWLLGGGQMARPRAADVW
ncbi:hypothetical protein D3C81_382660 [compost metagenome]|jgi:hypothetical protein|uniref:hypothetical protein n=1 Tax=unclassified Janthinobacterium TaxID=2610881 RepID=UPI000F94D821|nr:hypothetical protein [Janthinobacterium sp. AD80]